MKSNFTWHRKTGLTEQGFTELYLQQTAEDSSETFKDLKKLGYNETLESAFSVQSI